MPLLKPRLWWWFWIHVSSTHSCEHHFGSKMMHQLPFKYLILEFDIWLKTHLEILILILFPNYHTFYVFGNQRTCPMFVIYYTIENWKDYLSLKPFDKHRSASYIFNPKWQIIWKNMEWNLNYWKFRQFKICHEI